MRSVFLFLLLLALSEARENPFVPGNPSANGSAQSQDVNPPSDDDMSPDVNADGVSAEDTSETAVTTPSETVDFQTIRFVITEGEVRIETKDKLKKHFVIKDPTRIILDFASDGDFPTRRQQVGLAPFHEIRLGAHKGYYSVVMELDAAMRYRIVPTEGGYSLTLY